VCAAERATIDGSERTLAPGAHASPEGILDRQIEVTIRLRPRSKMQFPQRRTQPPAEGESSLMPTNPPAFLNREDYEGLYGADPSDVEKVRRFAREFNLLEIGTCAGKRSIRLTGAIPEMNRAFGTTLKLYRYPLGKYLGREGSLSVPSELHDIIQGVFGLDDRPQAQPNIVWRNRENDPDFHAASLGEIETRYAFPDSLNGLGEFVGILEFGGGITPEALKTYFAQLGVTPPEISFEIVGGTNKPNQDQKADTEVALDIELAGSLAPGAAFVMYFSRNDEKGWIDVLCQAIHNSNLTVLSISWGATESEWGRDTIKALNDLLEDARIFGITVCVASGDDGCATDDSGRARVEFPASSPVVLACGGTAFDSGTEIVWNEGSGLVSGGGISDRVPRPKWQPARKAALDQPTLPARINPLYDGRLVPDVAALAESCYSVYVNGRYLLGVGGTSAVPPIWAALIARLNQGLRQRNLPRLGFFNQLLYSTPSVQLTLNDITDGGNGTNGVAGYRASKSWDYCTGWGSPNGTKLLRELLNR
jgi:kumamolisin